MSSDSTTSSGDDTPDGLFDISSTGPEVTISIPESLIAAEPRFLVAPPAVDNPTVTGDTADARDSLPVTPYAGSSGWSGSDTSRERAERDDRTGTTTHRQSVVLKCLEDAGPAGLTWAEMGAVNGWHHGQSSGPLSTMHSAGLITRLASERRNGSGVYVLAKYVNGRPTAEPKSTKSTRQRVALERIALLVDAADRAGDVYLNVATVKDVLATLEPVAASQ